MLIEYFNKIEEPFNCELFHKAVFFDKRSEINIILEENKNNTRLFETPDRLGNTALMIAVLRDHHE